MILTAKMRALAAERGERGPRAPALLDGVSAFQNTPYRLARVPLLVDAAAIAAARAQVEAYVGALDRLLAAYIESANTRAWFGLSSAGEDLILAGGRDNARVRVCRLDGYVDTAGPSSKERLRILENNADAPAGTLFTPRLNLFARRHWGVSAEPRLPMERSEAPFLDFLVAAARRESPRIAVLQEAGKSNRESVEVVAALAARGVAAELADPRDLEASSHGFVLHGDLVDVIWNKINTVSWDQFVRERPALVTAWCRALETGATVHVNGFAARYVAEAKTALAYLQRPAFLAGLEPAARGAVSALLPPSPRLDEDTLALALRERSGLVLKQRYDIRGDGVTIGRAVSEEVWHERVREAMGTGAIIQAYVEPTRAPVLFDGDTEPVELRHSLDWFLFDGRVVGLGSKANQGFKVNLFQGGTKLPVVQVST
ncbi:hypothetical protein [Haliangium ochraceum]|uniref:Circularly permuted type 2 ATP-grasp protein n=1 Tax=Haliangium ochraceum (strain DSM 14365 / JCM 11303 / SMP-2) TaxID=502025 RepID=D0LRX7_HALO1|nr:hypothetical protein [Haliangium ochraceum]ACY13674.1 hypothetical protein Hoch_1086 [Haliangium ochraceum DSM 14365]